MWDTGENGEPEESRFPIYKSTGRPSNQRGQTLYDYVLGISVFILAVSAAVGVLPSLLATTSADGSSAALSASADRVAGNILSNSSTALAGTSPTLRTSGMTTLAGLSDAQLHERFAVRRTWQLNVTVESLDGDEIVTTSGGTVLAAGDQYRGGPTGRAVRIVTLSDPSGTDCSPACRLVVRVWR